MQTSSKRKLLVVTALIAAGLVAYAKFGELLSLNSLAMREDALRSYQSDHAQLLYLIAFGVYVTAAGLSIPGAAGLTLLYGWFFGFVGGTLLVSLASVSGATVAFLLSRYLFREWIEAKSGERVEQFNKALDREGPFYLFTLRLIPVVPFFVINAVMGLTTMKTVAFWWVSQLGMLPATVAYVYAGSSVPTLAQLAERGYAEAMSGQMVVALALLGIFPLVVRWLFGKLRPTESKLEETR